jgi:putative nucleotidyltransferase with HDIG domain
VFDAHAAALRLGQLSLSPEVLGRILELSDDPAVGPPALADVARADPGFTFEILRAVNTAQRGLARRIHSLPEAITLLGVRNMRNLALTLLVRHRFLSVPSNPYLRRENFWRHSIGAAVASEALARELGLRYTAIAYTAGLLHDLGILLLGLEAPRDLEEICRLVADGADPLAADRLVLGASHADVGAEAAEVWKLPELIRDVVRYHHRPQEWLKGGLLVDAVCVADVLMSPERPACYGGGPDAEHAKALEALSLDPDGDVIRRVRAATESQLTTTMRMFAGAAGRHTASGTMTRPRLRGD